MAEAVKFEPGRGGRSTSGPLAELEDIVRELERKGQSVDEYTFAVAEHMHAAVLEVFEHEGGFHNGPWPESDFSHRTREGGDNKLLQDTGNLVNSQTPAEEENVAEVFTNVPYAKYHISPEPRTIIPLRDFYDINEEEIAEYACEIILNGVLEGGVVPPG